MHLKTRLDPLRLAILGLLGLGPFAACGGRSADAGTSGPADAGTRSPMNPFPCAHPAPLVPGAATGYEVCDPGFIHRTVSVACPIGVPRNDVLPPSGFADTCSTDTDCVQSPYGYCSSFTGGNVAPGNYCVYGCMLDADCPSGQICMCGALAGTCVAASCRDDSDCAEGFLCTNYVAAPGCGGIAFACQRANDECSVNADCTATAPRECGYQPDVGHVCLAPSCAIGRPFLVDGLERLAPIEERADWIRSRELPAPSALRGALRSSAAQAWTRTGLMEHASIAAFARFTLELLALGAPAELVELATAAQADEARHARLAFALASQYAGQTRGPGLLDVTRSLEGRSPAEIVVTAIREGCVGETLASIEAQEAAAHAADPVVRDVWRSIAADETRHAELSFRFVAWALGNSARAPELRALLRRELERLERECAAEPASAFEPGDRSRLASGVVPDSLRRSIRARALGAVVVPCLRALLDSAELGPRRGAACDPATPVV